MKISRFGNFTEQLFHNVLILRTDRKSLHFSRILKRTDILILGALFASAKAKNALQAHPVRLSFLSTRRHCLQIRQAPTNLSQAGLSLNCSGSDRIRVMWNSIIIIKVIIIFIIMKILLGLLSFCYHTQQMWRKERLCTVCVLCQAYFSNPAAVEDKHLHYTLKLM